MPRGMEQVGWEKEEQCDWKNPTLDQPDLPQGSERRRRGKFCWKGNLMGPSSALAFSRSPPFRHLTTSPSNHVSARPKVRLEYSSIGSKGKTEVAASRVLSTHSCLALREAECGGEGEQDDSHRDQ